MTIIIQQLGEALGPDGFVDSERLRGRATSYWDSSPTQARCLLRPTSTEQLSAIMKICHEHGQSVVMQGGLTGIVEGALSTADDIIISLERMNEIESVDVLDGVAVIQAGAVLQTVQEELAEQGFLFPLDFGARGSATIGGAAATNAGGLNVLRYGMMRNIVLGLEAVLADGTVISSMNTMLKNNTGYDLKQLFIGSEGTLGIVTRVVVKLYPLTTSRQTAMLAMNSFDEVVRVLQTMRTDLAGTLSAYEVMWNNYFTAVTGEGGNVAPLARDYPFYVLAEAEGSDPEADEGRFQRLLERGYESGDIVDAVVPKSESERDALWAVREQFEVVQPAYLYDVSMPMKVMNSYAEKLEVGLKAWRPDAECNVFGHIADGNLHIFVKPFDDGIHHAASDKIVYGCLEGLGGSISAEHGIGIEKKQWLGATRSPAEIQMMRSLKNLLDPKNILNPGKVVD